ncbi:MAG: hypothetical protein QCH35_10110 [Methanomicrobiaceae archaeon]|nr:hypothetical protein [Methanomicrobiaceae archaeon]
MNLPHFDPCCIACANRTGRLHPPGTPFGDAPLAIRWQTGRIWKESGIAPPLRERRAVELLHRMAMAEDAAAVMRAARDSGIATDGRTDRAIACTGAAAVTGEYNGPHRAMVPQE